MRSLKSWPGRAEAPYIESGLGVRYRLEVQAATAWIGNNPELPNFRPNGYRRVNLKVFPYYVAYVIHSEIIWILAIAHSARRPVLLW